MSEHEAESPAGEPFVPADVYTIHDVDTLKILADPYRLRLIEAIGEDRVTVKEVAARMGEGVHRLYYHVRQLEEHGLLVQVASRVVSGIVEKTYALVGRRFEVEPGLLGADAAGEEHLLAMVRSITGSAVEAIARAARAGVIGTGEGKDGRMRVTRATLRLDDARARELVDRLDALVQEFGESPAEDDAPVGGTARPFGLTVVFHELAGDATETREGDDA